MTFLIPYEMPEPNMFLNKRQVLIEAAGATIVFYLFHWIIFLLRNRELDGYESFPVQAVIKLINKMIYLFLMISSGWWEIPRNRQLVIKLFNAIYYISWIGLLNICSRLGIAKVIFWYIEKKK